ncbi:DNA internalization-related competence protein ComEC/Rec2 [Enterococcus dongliensis]|nr:DNA internalization-related competence protein ComEC/Rec2 [Enterococcus dongliensis]
MILPILAAVLLASLIYQPALWNVVLLNILLIRIICMKNYKLLMLVFLCSLFLIPRTYFYVNDLIGSEKKLANQLVSIQADTVKVDGNLLKGIGQIQNKKYLMYYTLQSPVEKAVWQNKELPTLVLISGESEKFTNARNLNGFDEKKYYQSLGISQKIYVQSLEVFKHRKKTLKDFRRYLIWKIDQRYSQRVASYVKAIVIGYKDEWFSEYTAAYKMTGLLHLFTLSGLHIQFYLGMFHLLLKRFGLTRKIRLGLLSILGIALIYATGESFSTIRAVLSFLITFICLTFELRLAKLDQWSIILFLMFLCFPLLFWSVAAQLSLYFAIVLLYLNDLHLKNWQRIFLFSFLSLPMLVYHFSEWSILGGLLTLLAFPLFEWIILPGCILLFLGCFLPIPDLFNSLLDHFFQLIEKSLGQMTAANITIGKPIFIVFLLLLFLVFLSFDRLKSQQKCYWLLGGALVLLTATPYSASGMIAFIDVGQGDSIFIKLPFKQETFLIDTGGRLNFKQQRWQIRQTNQVSDYNLLPLLKSLGCSKIDHLLITHNDSDHMGELIHVLKKIKVSNLYLAEGSQLGLKKYLNELNETNIQLVKKGDTIGRRLKMQILSPQKSQGTNNDSLVTYFYLNQQRFLLTGDLEVSGETELLKNYPQLKTDFLKIGHHGSNTSTGDELLKNLQPNYAIISVGKKNRYGHPTEETLLKLEKYQVNVFRTDRQGMVYYEWSAITKRGRIKVLIDFLD